MSRRSWGPRRAQVIATTASAFASTTASTTTTTTVKAIASAHASGVRWGLVTVLHLSDQALRPPTDTTLPPLLHLHPRESVGVQPRSPQCRGFFLEGVFMR